MIRIWFGMLVVAAAVAFLWWPSDVADAAAQATGQPAHTKGQPVESGAVAWARDLSASLSRSKETGKPVFLLFQEIPG